jgi:hypothetical protein
MKLQISRNFSFSKILDKSERIIKDVIGETAEVVVETSTKFIRDGKVRPDILTITKDRKRAKGSPTPDIPLMDTGNLVNTMKVVGSGFQMAEYGWIHHNGIGKNKTRMFLPFTEDMKNFKDFTQFNEKINNRFAERIRKAMKSSKKIQ